MLNSKKLKPIKWNMIIVNSIIFLVVFFSLFAIIRSALTPKLADRICGITYFIITITLLIFWFRTKLVLILPGMLMNLMITIHFFTHIEIVVILINILLLASICYMLYVHYKHISIYRKILELSAHTITDTKNGYTPRSYPVGEITFSKGELFGFAEYLKKQLIAVPFVEDSSVVLVLAEDWFGYQYDLHGGYNKVTRIVFNYEGSVTATISRAEYSKYKQALTFDQLCASLGNVFIEFLQHFQQGENNKIHETILKTK